MSDEIDKLHEELAFFDGLGPSTEDMEITSSPPTVSQDDIDWMLFMDELKEVKTVERSLEMVLDMALDMARTIQFCQDVETYGLYEAVMYLQGTKAHDTIRSSILTEMRLSKLPKTNIHARKASGKVVETRKNGLRPESIWALQKHLILDQTFDARAKKIFESVLPFASPPNLPKPNTSSDFIRIAEQTSLWEAVTQAPIKYREALCQRLLVLYAIPDPEPPKVTRHHIVKGVQAKPKDRVLVVDKAGNAWTWDCGWFMVEENGQAKRCRERKGKKYQTIVYDESWGIAQRCSKQRADIRQQPMGHAEFRRVIKPADATDYAKTSFRYTRPWGQWRKGSGPVAHDLFGNGVLVLTDGVHAVVEFADGVKREVVLDNLRNIGERSVARGAKADAVKTPRKKKEATSLSLEEMLKML